MSRIERDGSTNMITIHPAEGKHSASIVICHGLGDSADGFADVAELLCKQFPYLKAILPSAKTQPVTVNMGSSCPSWYDITGLDAASSESVEGIDESVAVVRGIVDSEISLGILPSRIILAGFSQGGALSLFTGLQLPVECKPCGIIVMSGYLCGSSRLKMTDGFEDVPILHCHGTGDMVVRYDWAQKTKEAVEEKGIKSYDLRSYEGMAHTVNAGVLAAVQEFVSDKLPLNEDLAIKIKDPSEMSIKELKTAVRNAGLSSKALGFSEKQEFVFLLKSHYDGSA